MYPVTLGTAISSAMPRDGSALRALCPLSNRRLSVVRCLADAYDLNSLDKFSTASGDPAVAVGAGMERTYITIPKNLLDKVRQQAVKESARTARKTSVSDIIVEILARELK